MLGVSGALVAGDVKAFTTSGRGLNPKEIADMAMKRIVGVSAGAPWVIQLQTEAFKTSVRSAVETFMQVAQWSERATVGATLRAQGEGLAAASLGRLMANPLASDEIVARCVGTIIGISDKAPKDIAEQAHAFRDRLSDVLTHHVVQARRSERTTIYNILTAAGFTAVAAQIV